MSPRLDDTAAVMDDPRAVTLTIGSDTVSGLFASPAVADLDVTGNSPSLLVRAALLPASAVAGASCSIGADGYRIEAVEHTSLLMRTIRLEAAPVYELLSIDLTAITTETWLDEENPSQVHEPQEGIVVVRAGSPRRAHGLIRIPAISGLLPAGAVIVSAELLVYANPSAGPTWSVHRSPRSAVLSQATWSVYRTGSGWSTPGALALVTDYTLPAFGSGVGSGEGEYVSIASGSDFATHVKVRQSSAWFLVIHASGSGEMQFYMSNQGNDIAPILRVGYHL